MDTWEENSKLVLSELQRLDRDIKEVQRTQARILQEIAGLKSNAAIWGALAGIIPAIIMGVVSLLIKN